MSAPTANRVSATTPTTSVRKVLFAISGGKFGSGETSVRWIRIFPRYPRRSRRATPDVRHRPDNSTSASADVANALLLRRRSADETAEGRSLDVESATSGPTESPAVNCSDTTAAGRRCGTSRADPATTNDARSSCRTVDECSALLVGSTADRQRRSYTAIGAANERRPLTRHRRGG